MKSARSLAIGVVALALLATGCTSSGDDEDTAAPGGTITVWTHINKSFNKSYQELVDAYMAENPDATIKLETFDYDSYIQTLQTSLPAGNEADVLQMFGSWTCSYCRQPVDGAGRHRIDGRRGGRVLPRPPGWLPVRRPALRDAAGVERRVRGDAREHGDGRGRRCGARRLGVLRRVQGGRQEDDGGRRR